MLPHTEDEISDAAMSVANTQPGVCYKLGVLLCSIYTCKSIFMQAQAHLKLMLFSVMVVCFCDFCLKKYSVQAYASMCIYVQVYSCIHCKRS